MAMPGEPVKLTTELPHRLSHGASGSGETALAVRIGTTMFLIRELYRAPHLENWKGNRSKRTPKG